MTSRQRNTALVVAALIAAACLAVLLFVLWRMTKDTTGIHALSETEARNLIQAKNVGLAHLENHETALCIPFFLELVEKIPAEPLGPRNLTVARVLALGDDYERATPELLDDARAALAQMRTTEGATREWHWLSARVAAAAQDFAAAEGHLQAIVTPEPENAGAWSELFLVQQSSDDAAQRERAFAALLRAYELRPDNLFVLVEYLRQLEARISERNAAIAQLPGDQQPAARRELISTHDRLVEHLQQARRTLAPFQDRLLAIGRVDPLALLDEAIRTAQNADTVQLAEKLGQVSRITLGIAATDRNQIRRHTLEFVLDRFEPEFYERHGLAETETSPAIAVSFEPAARLQLGDAVEMDFAGVKSVELADFDLDGRLDLIVLDQAGVHVFSLGDNGGPWRQIASAAVPDMVGLVVQDFDLDFDETPVQGPRSEVQGPRSNVQGPGLETEKTRADEQAAKACPSADVDIVVYGPEGAVVLKNQLSPATGARSLERVEQATGELSNIRAVTAADLDADGDLDLVVAAADGVTLWSNRGNATFDNITRRSSVPPAGAAISQLVALDWDRDVDIDVLVAGEPSGWLENLRHGQMRWRAFDPEFPVGAARAMEVVDADANASWDLLAAGADGMRLVRTLTPSSGVIRPLAAHTIADFGANKLRAFDYDNDGVMDLLAWNDNAAAIYRGSPGGQYQAADLLKSLPPVIRDCAAGDLDGDGDLDLVVASDERISVLSNEGGNANHWLDVALKARQIKGSETSASGRVNAHGVGNLLELKAGTRYQPAVVRGQSTHFGLGRDRTADVVRVLWLNGVPQNIIQPPPQRAVCEQQLLTGSCPYLYAWNGRTFEFVTDLLWAAPLGLQAADGVLLPSREWEYIKIPGDNLVKRDGEYVLQITEELWEAAYFDEVKLIAIDHPAEVDIFSNEKVGPAEIAGFKVHTVRQRRQPIAARNHRGRDVLDEIANRDGRYAKVFEQKLRQGLVEDHFIELDLGDLGDAKRITLYLTGWIYPSGTSLNVAVSQNPDLPRPKPPSLLVPDGNGEWKEALDYMGFPGGKTKTIAVDLAGVFAMDDYRVRIATNLEFYWDEIFFSVDEQPVELRQSELELGSADLHARGFSRIVHDPGYGPERFVHDQPSTAPKWPPMLGRLTRFGDVTELVRKRDDRLLVFGAGDEVTLRFRAPADDPPAGWKRDFMLYSVGWDKDANLCTVLGQTVEPLPFQSMRSYPPSGDERPPDSDEYRAYLREYQTRSQDERFWRMIRQ